MNDYCDRFYIYPHRNCNGVGHHYLLVFSGYSCETPHACSLFNSFRTTTIPSILQNSIPHDTRSVPLLPTKKQHHGPEPGHLRQRTHDLSNSVPVRGSCCCEHGDERGEKGRFERGAEERWEGLRVDRLWVGSALRKREGEDTG